MTDNTITIPIGMELPRCMYCSFFTRSRWREPSTCHRYPPVVVDGGQAQFPEVGGFYSCGEFRPDPDGDTIIVSR